jgi:Protein of unknown function (DUF2695)
VSEYAGITRDSLLGLRAYWTGVASEYAGPAIEQIDACLEAPDPLTDEEWDRYFDFLADPDACNFQQDDETEQITWTCKGGTDKTFSEQILRERLAQDNAGVEAVHRIVDALGGHCDCEIVLNADERIRG